MRPLIQVENLVKRYATRRSSGLRNAVYALNGVSFSIAQGKTLSLVGASGAGKSTLALCLAGLERPTSGRVWFDACDIAALSEKELRPMRPQIQLIFQDPASSLNPRFNVLEAISEPLVVQPRARKRDGLDEAIALLKRVGLSVEMAERRIGELSGGQRQRLAIARALVLQPKLLIFDEALSALDCSVQAQIANLLMELQSCFALTYLFITHDLAMAAHLGDEIAVLDQGTIVEQGTPEAILDAPEQGATKLLAEAAPGSNLIPRVL